MCRGRVRWPWWRWSWPRWFSLCRPWLRRPWLRCSWSEHRHAVAAEGEPVGDRRPREQVVVGAGHLDGHRLTPVVEPKPPPPPGYGLNLWGKVLPPRQDARAG